MKTPRPSLLLLAALLVASTEARTADGLAGATRTRLQFKQTVDPVMPLSLNHEGVTQGHAYVAIQVGADGVLNDMLLTGCSDSRLGQSALAALKEWKFTPATFEGEPIGVITEIRFFFESGAVLISITSADAMNQFMQHGSNTNAYALSTLKQLDRVPALTATAKPVYPTEWRERGVHGNVEVQFFVDESGTVRMPHVISADHMALADIASDAIRQWKFEPPTSLGKPVVIRTRQKFVFDR